MEPHRPAVWLDDTRMNVLFSPFREKNLNPSSWNQKMKFWIQVIEDEYKHSNKCILERKSIPFVFKRKGKLPSCLDTVITEMLRLGKIRKLQNSDILQPPSEASGRGWLTWGYDTLLKSPITWSWKALTKDEKNEDNTQYILEECLKDQCTKVLQRHQCQVYCDIVSNIVEYSVLYIQCGDLCSSELEFKVVLQQLVIENKAVISSDQDTVVVKFISRDDDQVKKVTEEDLKILRIKKTSGKLLNDVEKLSAVSERLKMEAIQHKNQSKRQHALRTFRQYKRIQDRISKLSNSIDFLDDILNRISHAASEEMIVKAIESGTQALKSINERNDLDKVTDIMDDLSQTIEDQEDIQNELGRLNNEEEESLEASLENLLKGDNSPLEDVPSTLPDTMDGKGDQLSSADELADLLSDLKLPDVPDSPPEEEVDCGKKKIPAHGDIFIPDLSLSETKMTEKPKKKKEAA
ncbi:charged multivesicular body protein 7-like [Saccostrea cucullata]|uniref:charged multivesicular body protein 7-like n=1 Tax=Saccostrea cuccullata TaxID=36930 RepID=UPI002ED0B129